MPVVDGTPALVAARRVVFEGASRNLIMRECHIHVPFGFALTSVTILLIRDAFLIRGRSMSEIVSHVATATEPSAAVRFDYALGRASLPLGTDASPVEQMSSARAAWKILSARFCSSPVSV